MAPPLLVLFDVDGTLFLTDDPLLGRSVIETLEEIYDVALPEDAIQNVDHAGQTSKRIARLVLSRAGLDERSIDARLHTSRARMERLGLARFFPEGQGAFGCEGETRAELLALARGRAGGSEAWP